MIKFATRNMPHAVIQVIYIWKKNIETNHLKVNNGDFFILIFRLL
jgi:hypothetical protein